MTKGPPLPLKNTVQPFVLLVYCNPSLCAVIWYRYTRPCALCPIYHVFSTPFLFLCNIKLVTMLGDGGQGGKSAAILSCYTSCTLHNNSNPKQLMIGYSTVGHE